MRKILDKFFPLGTRRRNFLFNSKKIAKKLLGKKSRKALINDHNSELLIYDKYSNSYEKVKCVDKINKSIGVHLHLYYKDLLDEMISYLNNIPYKFDLFVSVVDKDNNQLVVEKLKKIKNVSKVELEVTKNSGRDYGPMIVAFGKKLSKYDYICHIHTKKSLRMGVEQEEWRKNLLNGILGSKELVKEIFYLFEEKNIGTFFQSAPSLAPYWGNTWLGVTGLARNVFNELGIPFKDSYLDFSVGSMFWIRTDACRQIFNKKWSWKDFGDEQGLNDGTMAYVFEKIFVQVSNYNNYDYICYDMRNNLFLKNSSERNMQDYYSKNIEWMYEKLKKYDVVSFDIFDTLITRKIYSPDDLFDLVGKKLNISNFRQLRKQAEISVNTKISPDDPSIYQIYEEYAKLNKISSSNANQIMETEISYEKEFMIARSDMLELFNRLKKNGNTIILTSDMYLTSDVIGDILKKCGYTGYKKIYVSCETNLRKDRAEIWDFLRKEYSGKTFIHVGDNEESDVHLLWDVGVDNEHIMSGKKMFDNTSYSYFNKGNLLNDNTFDSVLYGLIINKKLFNSPFKFNKSNNNYSIENLNEFGYSIIGPILLKYLLWIIQNYKNETLLLISREGYYFEKLLDILVDKLDLKNIDKTYFLASRRCVTCASIKSIEDIYKLLDIEYYGDIKNFMFYRYGVKYTGDNFDVNLSDKVNYEKVKSVVDNYTDAILKEAKREEKNYIKYISKTVKNYKNKELCVVDLGYSGTTQYYLSKILDRKVSGKYLVVKDSPKPLKIDCKVESCYNSISNDNNHVLYKNSLFLECFLTAPTGQLMYFDDNGQPVYTNEKLIKVKQKYLNEIYKGVEELFNDICDLLDTSILDYQINIDSLLGMYGGFLLESKNFIDNNRDLFTFEDYYCRNDKIIIEKQ